MSGSTVTAPTIMWVKGQKQLHNVGQRLKGQELLHNAGQRLKGPALLHNGGQRLKGQSLLHTGNVGQRLKGQALLHNVGQRLKGQALLHNVGQRLKGQSPLQLSRGFKVSHCSSRCSNYHVGQRSVTVPTIMWVKGQTLPQISHRSTIMRVKGSRVSNFT